MICLIKQFLIDEPNSEETRTICIYEKHNELYFVRIDGDNASDKELNPSIRLNSLSDINIYIPYFTREDIGEIRKIIRKSRISKLLEEKSS
jgi:hypothetical protein